VVAARLKHVKKLFFPVGKPEVLISKPVTGHNLWLMSYPTS